MSLAWEVSDEDVAIVLKHHGIQDSQTADRAIGLCRQAHAPRIERAALAYDEIERQSSSALSEIENVLIEAGILSMPKLLRAR